MPKPSEWDVVATEEIGPWDVVETVPFGLVEPGQTAPLPESRETKQSPFSFSDIARKFGRGALDVMPEAGMLAGDAVGTFYGGQAMGPLASAVGGFTMEGARQGIEQGILGTEEFPGFGENLGAMWDKGKEAFVGDVAGAGIFKGLGVVAKPAQLTKTGRMYLDSDEIKRATELIEKHNLPISPAALVAHQKGGLPIKVAQALADFTPPGMMHAAHKRTQLMDALQDMRTRLTEGMPGTADDRVGVGTELLEDLDRIARGTKDAKAELYRVWARGMGEDPVTVPNLFDALHDVLHTTDNNETRKWAGAWVNKIEGAGLSERGTLMPNEINELRMQIWNKLPYNKTESGHAVMGALKGDLPSDGARAALDVANENFQLIKAFEDNSKLKKLLGLKKAEMPEKAIRTLFRSGNLEQVRLLQREMDPEVWQVAKGRFLQNMLEAEQKQGEFDPSKFLKYYKNYEKQFKNVFSEQESANISTFAEIIELSMYDIKRVARNPAAKFGIPALGGGLAVLEIVKSGGLSGWTGAALGSSWLMAKSLMNPKGKVRRLLTTGLEPSAILEPMAKVGAMNAVEGEVGPGFYHRMKAMGHRSATPDELSDRVRRHEKPPS